MPSFEVKVEFGFLTYPVEVMEDPQTFDGVQFLAAGVQFVEPAGNVIGNTVKEGLGLIHIFLVGGRTVMYRSCTTLLDESVTLSVSMALYSARYPSRESSRRGEQDGSLQSSGG